MACKKVGRGGISPCKKVCKVRVGYCIGCRRTLEEIASWAVMSEPERLRIMTEILPGREVAQLLQEGQSGHQTIPNLPENPPGD